MLLGDEKGGNEPVIPNTEGLHGRACHGGLSKFGRHDRESFRPFSRPTVQRPWNGSTRLKLTWGCNGRRISTALPRTTAAST